ncbi:CapA family protein [Salegentibacter chungangensis]|uniref:CapA family protein n=1 Tax=Salegentibacter chungangensis TaxID=1335724 RepID=A0ABW3NTI3_9FLAO
MDTGITIGFGGDTMLGRGVNAKISETNYFYPWGDLLDFLKKTDLNILNLETTLTESKERVPKVFNFKAEPDKVQTLIAAKIGAVTIANNHILDFSEKGLLETIEVLDKAGIRYVGAGKNKKEATEPLILDVKDLKLGLLGYTDNEPGWIASANPGTNYLEVGDTERIKKDISALRKEVDILIVSYHWGPNMRVKPTRQFQDFAHKIIDFGADIIHGHSAHIFQGIEIYNKGLIMYDTGDFVDDYVVDPVLRNDRSFFFIIEADRSGLKKLKLIPVRIRNMQVNKARAEDYDWTLKRMQKLSSELGTEVSGNGIVELNG